MAELGRSFIMGAGEAEEGKAQRTGEGGDGNGQRADVDSMKSMGGRKVCDSV